MSLDITDVRVVRLNSPKSKIVGFATITFNDVLVVEDWKIINGANGLFVTGPSKKVEGEENSYRDTVKLVSKDANAAMQRAVIAAYEKVDGSSSKPAAKPAAKASGKPAPPQTNVRKQYGEYMDDVPAPSDADHRPLEEEDGPDWFN